MLCEINVIREIRIVDNILGDGILIFNRNNEKNSQHGRNIELDKTLHRGVLYKKFGVIKKDRKEYLKFNYNVMHKISIFHKKIK